MTVRALGTVTVGVAVPAIVEASSGISAAAAASISELTATLDGYLRAQASAVGAPEFSVGAQLAVAGEALVAASAELSALPGGAALAAGLTAGIAAQATAIATIKGTYPSVGAKIESAVAAVAQLSASVSLGVVGPNLDMALVAAKIAVLEGIKATIEAQLDLAARISSIAAVGGVTLLAFEGSPAEFGVEMAAALSGVGVPSFKTMVLVATTETAWGGIQAVIKTT